ncbi:MAG: fibrobacter succinogenes major paralogous domain-containing protein [Fibrobacteraceae bacterium]
MSYRLFQYLTGITAILGFISCGDSGTSSDVGSNSDLLSSTILESSSSETHSSANSSSSKVAWMYLNPSISYGEIEDARDKQVYKTVVIGTQTWMAENLNYAVDSSWCYNNSTDSCTKYGRLYQWAAAMNIDVAYNETAWGWGGSDVNHQGACPSGWHIPIGDEWRMLENAVGGGSMAGTALKSTSGWDESGNGTDNYGFSALPSGFRRDTSEFDGVDLNTSFWSAVEYDSINVFVRIMDVLYTFEFEDDYYKDYSFSVRCVKD